MANIYAYNTTKKNLDVYPVLVTPMPLRQTKVGKSHLIYFVCQ